MLLPYTQGKAPAALRLEILLIFSKRKKNLFFFAPKCDRMGSFLCPLAGCSATYVRRKQKGSRKSFRPLAGYSATAKMPNTSEKVPFILNIIANYKGSITQLLKKWKSFSQKTAVLGVRALFSPAMKGYPKSSVRTKRLCAAPLPCIGIFFNAPPACYRTENQQKASFPETGFLLEIQGSVIPTARNSAAWGHAVRYDIHASIACLISTSAAGGFVSQTHTDQPVCRHTGLDQHLANDLCSGKR